MLNYQKIGITPPAARKVKRRWIVISFLVCALAGLGVNAAFAGERYDYPAIPNETSQPQSPGYQGYPTQMGNSIPDSAECSPGGILVFNPSGYMECELAAVERSAGEFLNLAFDNPLTSLRTQTWEVAFSQAAHWAGVLAPIAIALCAVQIVVSALARNSQQLLKAVVLLVLSWPMNVMALMLFAQLAHGMDIVTENMVRTVFSGGGVGGFTAAGGIALGSAIMGPIVAGTPAGWLAAALVVLAVLLLALGVTIILGAVSFGMLILATLSPVAFMLLVFKGTKDISMKWVKTVISLLLVKPVIAGVFVLCIALIADAGPSGAIMGFVGLIFAMLSPMGVMKFVDFTGAQLGGAAAAGGFAKKAAKTLADKEKAIAGKFDEAKSLENEAKELAAAESIGEPGAGGAANSKPAASALGGNDGVKPENAIGSSSAEKSPHQSPAGGEATPVAAKSRKEQRRQAQGDEQGTPAKLGSNVPAGGNPNTPSKGVNAEPGNRTGERGGDNASDKADASLQSETPNPTAVDGGEATHDAGESSIGQADTFDADGTSDSPAAPTGERMGEQTDNGSDGGMKSGVVSAGGGNVTGSNGAGQPGSPMGDEMRITPIKMPANQATYRNERGEPTSAPSSVASDGMRSAAPSSVGDTESPEYTSASEIGGGSPSSDSVGASLGSSANPVDNGGSCTENSEAPGAAPVNSGSAGVDPVGGSPSTDSGGVVGAEPSEPVSVSSGSVSSGGGYGGFAGGSADFIPASGSAPEMLPTGGSVMNEPLGGSAEPPTSFVSDSGPSVSRGSSGGGYAPISNGGGHSGAGTVPASSGAPVMVEPTGNVNVAVETNNVQPQQSFEPTANPRPSWREVGAAAVGLRPSTKQVHSDRLVGLQMRNDAQQNSWNSMTPADRVRTADDIWKNITPEEQEAFRARVRASRASRRQGR